MKPSVEVALDECLAGMRDGADVDACVRRYPELAEELRPLVELAAELRRVRLPAPADAARTAGQERMLAALAARSAPRSVSRPSRRERPPVADRAPRWRPAWQWAAVLLLVLLAAGTGAAFAASASSLPGDVLYRVKLAGQKAELALTFGRDQRQHLEVEFEEVRRQDVRSAIEDGRKANVDFEGTLEETEEGVWQVGGLPTILDERMMTSGQPHRGTKVHVQGYLAGDGRVVVTELGIEPSPTPRATETAEAPETMQPPETEEPTEQESCTPPAPTEAPEATAAPEATRVDEPTKGPTPTIPAAAEEEKPSPTPEPTETGEPTKTPRLTETHEPTKTPEPTETHEPTKTPEPTKTQRPTPTRESGKTPEASATPDE